ncbi:hypothetical protein BJ165DRAFT_459123 [Panaeolus papilionaceus]|nr:hypothetical protein BJ165DRAFT_459123 [Panaeolus papilionaceus]
MTSTTAPFLLINAFTTSAFGGNPCLVLFLDEIEGNDEQLSKTAINFQQPMMSVVSKTALASSIPNAIIHDIRFFASNGKQVPICGHGTLAAAAAIFSLPEMAASPVSGGLVEIVLPSGPLNDTTDEEKKRLQTFLDRAFGREVKVNNIKTGGENYSVYNLVELDESENLAGSEINADELRDNGYVVNVITTSSPTSDELCVSRMFSPSMINGGEDPVCGSAHALLAPYWYGKKAISPGNETKARQVSKRGGILYVVYEEAESRVRLRGQSCVFASGQINVSK